MAKFVILVIDGFGIGAMDDVMLTRPEDIHANTCLNIFKSNPSLHLPNLEQLGLMNSLGFEINRMKFQETANFGCANLMHDGADTFMGHQEILGTQPKVPLRLPFSSVIQDVQLALEKKGYLVEKRGVLSLTPEHPAPESTELNYLWVNNSVAIGDNLEADLGQVFNLTANLNKISFAELMKIGMIVRDQVKVDRVIAFGGLLNRSNRIHEAAEIKACKYIGINAPRSGAYDKGFEVAHLGYGVDASVQVPYLLNDIGISTTLIGKVADIVANPYGDNYMQLVDTQKILDITIDALKQPGDRFICTNIQESDLSGHAQSVTRYSNILTITDNALPQIIEQLSEQDMLVVMADHGNDPTIGHSKHTRENVPLLIYKKGVSSVNIGVRRTLADVGATACEFFSAKAPQNGESFLSSMQ